MTAGLEWLLDTNTLSALMRRPVSPDLLQRLATAGDEAVCTSIIVAAEMRFGAERKGSPALTDRVNALLATITVLPIDGEADRHYADIRAALERSGTPIGGNDLWIAAHARSRGLVLVTHNTREFKRVPGLVVEDWLID
ncbi:type II toxin-antitoxin system VapC family toxin [Sphaerotilus sp.]|uniref:type II toxin-antitoxin system VapC family toxin n=1 Tax=Sphaerotilus sp. TaxID=2093942 RepID=UPI00286D8D0E|nr:type II toxin-antitoxin system VapC family toxin [Sphaerotilus sp.]